MSPPSIRGILISLKEAAIVLGILLGYLIGFLFSTVDGGWAYTFGLAVIFAAIMLGGSYFLLVESTRFLYLKGKAAQAKESMDWILTPEASERAFNEMGTPPPPSSIILSDFFQLIKILQLEKLPSQTLENQLISNHFHWLLVCPTIWRPTLPRQSTRNDFVPLLLLALA